MQCAHSTDPLKSLVVASEHLKATIQIDIPPITTWEFSTSELKERLPEKRNKPTCLIQVTDCPERLMHSLRALSGLWVAKSKVIITSGRA